MPGVTQASTASRGNEGLKISAKLRQILGGGTRRIIGSKIAATLDKTDAARRHRNRAAQSPATASLGHQVHFCAAGRFATGIMMCA